MNAFENAFQLISRRECHLCWAMEKALREFLKSQNIGEECLEVVDIDAPESAEFLEKYNILVPVLLLNGVEICHYHFDESAVLKSLKTP